MSAHSQTADPDQIESADGGIAVSIGRILKLLARPELKKWRPIMVIAILLTLGAAVLEVAFPLLIGFAINQLVTNEAGLVEGLMSCILWLSVAFGIRFLAAGLPQLRDWLFSPVSQDAQRTACVDAFGHAQGLSLGLGGLLQWRCNILHTQP